MADAVNYGTITGPIVMIGFGSIGRGTWPLLEKHFSFDREKFVVIEPDAGNHAVLDEMGLRYVDTALTPENFREVLGGLIEPGQGFCVNLSVDTSSLDIMKLTRELGVLYIDTVVEPWIGFYFDEDADPASRTNYFLRETVRAEKRANPGGTTAVSCCGANPGMVSWFVKQALLNLAADLGKAANPQPRDEWAALMRDCGNSTAVSFEVPVCVAWLSAVATRTHRCGRRQREGPSTRGRR